jgi:hypothetical protein
MNWFNTLPGSKTARPGIESYLLRRMPRYFVLATLLPVLAAMLARFFPSGESAADIAASLKLVDIVAFGVIVLNWTLLLTLSIACYILRVMKGPAYVADAYPLEDSDQPQRRV